MAITLQTFIWNYDFRVPKPGAQNDKFYADNDSCRLCFLPLQSLFQLRHDICDLVAVVDIATSKYIAKLTFDNV